MTHEALKQPLGKRQENVLTWLPVITLFILRCRAWARRVWAAMLNEQVHRGGPLLLANDDSLQCQWRLAQALGSSDRAMILQKLYEWIEHNKSKFGTATTFNGYKDWAADHFGNMSAHAIGRHVRAMEQMGILVTRRKGKGDQVKVYRIDYGKLNALLRQGAPSVNVKTPRASKNLGDSKVKTKGASMNTEDSNLNHDSNREPNLLPNQSTQSVTKPGRGGRRAGAGRKAKQKDALIETAKNATAQQPSVEASMGTADDQDSPSPNSAPPPSQAEMKLIDRLTALTLEDDKATGLIDQYGENRVRAVVRECERRLGLNEIHKPAGWIIAELKNDVFKLGEIAAAPDSDSHGNEIEAWRLEALRRENERMAEEEFEVGI